MADDTMGQSADARGRLPGALKVQTILRHGDEQAIEPSPVYPGTTITSPQDVLSRSSSTSSRHSLARTRSTNDPVRKNKRLSLTLPIQSALSSTQTRGQSPTRSIASSTTTIPEDFRSPTATDPTDTSFLTALAAQERRVLELKEELARADADLKKLKREWAAHEAQKKRHDSRRVHKMRPLSAALPGQEEEGGSSAWRAQELERRKSLLNSNKTSNRTVFSGSRHARTLSLLSPNGDSVEQQKHSRPPTAPSSAPMLPPSRPPLSHRPSSNADLTQEVAEVADESIDLGLPREVLMRTGKQMASDFKDGLWTFIEDLRQATVGEDAIQNARARNLPGERSLTTQTFRSDKAAQSKPTNQAGRRPQHARSQTSTGAFSSRDSTSSPSRKTHLRDQTPVDAESSFWQEMGLSNPATVDKHVVKKSPKKSSSHRSVQDSPSATESWDMWDSPVSHRTKDAYSAEAQALASAGGTTANSER